MTPVGSSMQVSYGEDHDGDLRNRESRSFQAEFQRQHHLLPARETPPVSLPKSEPMRHTTAFLAPEMKEMEHSDSLDSLDRSNHHMCPIVDLNR